MPWLQSLTDEFQNEEVRIVTVHSPEFQHEKDVSQLGKQVQKLNVHYPVYIDNDLRYFEAINSEGWPSLFLIDKNGLLRFIYLGETHSYFAQARDIERKIKLLLGEK